MLFYDFEDFNNVDIIYYSADLVIKTAFLKPLTKKVTLSTPKLSPKFSLRHSVREVGC